LVSKVVNVFLKESLNDLDEVELVLDKEYKKGSLKKMHVILTENFSKVFSGHYNSFKGIFKNDNVESSARFQAFVIATFRFFLIRLLLWVYGALNNDEADFIGFDFSSLNDELIIDDELVTVSGLAILFLELLDLELEFLNSVISNIRAFLFNSNRSISYFLYSSYSVYGKVPLLPEFHLVVMKTILPYVLRII